MNCAICGKDVPEGSPACPNCGTRLAPVDAAGIDTRRPADESPADSANPVTSGSLAADGEPAAEPLPGEFRASQPVQGQPASDQPASGYSASGQLTPGHQSGRTAPRRRRIAMVVIAVVLAILVGGGFIVSQVFGRDIRRRIMGPTKSYLMIEGLAMKDGMDRLAGGIADSVNQEDLPIGYDTSLSFKLAAPLPGIDANLMRTLNSLKLQTRTLLDRKAAGPKLYTRSDLFTGSERLLGLEAYAAEDQLALGLPGLIDPYISVPVTGTPTQPNQQDPAGSIYTQSLMDVLKRSFEQAPLVDKAQLAASLDKVADVFLANIDSAEFTDKVPVTAGGITVPYECYTVKSNGRQLRDMAVGTLELVRDEKPLSDLVYPYFRDQSGFAFGSSGQMAGLFGGFPAPGAASRKPMTESEWKAMLNQAIDRLKAVADADLQDLAFTQRVYVDKQDKIHGRELNVVKASDNQMVDLKILAPAKDGQHGLLVALAGEDGDDPSVSDGRPHKPFDLQLTANYEEKDGLATGSADVMFDGKTPLTATYRGLGSQAVGSERYLIGEIDFNLDYRSIETIRTPIPKMTLKGSVSGSHHVMEIAAAGLVSITVDQTRLPAAEVKIPSLSGKTMVQADDEAALASLMTMDVQMKLLAILQKLNIDPSMFF